MCPVPVTGASEVELAALILVTAAGFLATNVDNLLILMGLLAAEADRRRGIFVGFALAAAGVLLLALLCGLAGTLVDPAWLGYLGLLPVALGCRQLYLTIRYAASGPPNPRDHGDQPVNPAAGSGLSAFLLMASNSGDSFALFLPLFAESRFEALIVEVSVCILMILLWCLLAGRAAETPSIANRLQRHGRYLVPLLMIAVGVYVLLDTGTDTL